MGKRGNRDNRARERRSPRRPKRRPRHQDNDIPNGRPRSPLPRLAKRALLPRPTPTKRGSFAEGCFWARSREQSQ